MTSKDATDGASPPKPRRRLNASQKRALKTARMAIYLKQVGRKAQKGTEPNDRHDTYDLDKTLRQIPPEEMDLLMRDDEDPAE